MNNQKAPFWARAWWTAERTLNHVLAIRHMRLNRSAKNEDDGRTVTDVLVSLTTYGARFDTVHLTIQSILAGYERPARIILWVNDQESLENPPAELRALFTRGLEIRLTEDLGPHKKYYPALAQIPMDGSTALVTADDDILYPRNWLKRLRAAWATAPESIHAYRCHRIRFSHSVTLAPYTTWTPALLHKKASTNFFTGASGVLYPYVMVKELRSRGMQFRDCAPRADDVWLNYVAASTHIDVYQVHRYPIHFPHIIGSQTQSLAAENVGREGNDRQILETYDQNTIKRLYATR